MANNVSQFLVSIAIVTIFSFLWHARHRHFARIGKSWRFILLGFACLSAGEISKLVMPALAIQGRVSAAAIEAFNVAGGMAIVLGLLLVVVGVYQWLSAVQDLCLESVRVKKRNIDLSERVSRDGMLLSTIPAALYCASGSPSDKTTEIIFVNNKIEDLLGYSAAEFSEDPLLLLNLMHDEDKKRYEESEWSELWDKDNVVVEHRFRHKNGEYRWLRRHLNRINSHASGLTEWHGCAFDITDLKRAEARLTKFLEAAPDPVVTVNAKGEIVLANAQAERLFGYSRAELLGQYAHILIPDEVRHRHIKKFAKYLTETTSRMIDDGTELVGRRKDGTEFPAEISLSPIDSCNEKLVAFAIRDVSARKNTEAQLRQSQKMEAIGQLTGGIAHDFNNMLTVVIGNLELIERESTEDEAIGHATQAAMKASMRAAELVERLLVYARRQVLAPKTTRINDLVTGIEAMLHRTITENVTLKTSLADDLWLATIDPSQLENTLLNLAINSRDALGSGGKLTIETSNTVLDESYAAQHREVTPGDYVLIAVSDNGQGIPEEVLPHVFEPFYSTKETGKGSGLGLSMVYGFVKQSQGHIKIYSEEGYGTTIKIYIPRAKSSREDPIEHVVCNKAVPAGEETILLVEDDGGVREIACRLLTSLGYKVLHAESGSEALRVMEEYDNIGLLFTDLVMPGGMTGADLARRALAKYPDLKVLYTTGYADMPALDAGLLQHSSDVLNKPYRKEELAHAVRDILDRE